jgi:hypothetical protein
MIQQLFSLIQKKHPILIPREYWDQILPFFYACFPCFNFAYFAPDLPISDFSAAPGLGWLPTMPSWRHGKHLDF